MSSTHTSWKILLNTVRRIKCLLDIPEAFPDYFPDIMECVLVRTANRNIVVVYRKCEESDNTCKEVARNIISSIITSGYQKTYIDDDDEILIMGEKHLVRLMMNEETVSIHSHDDTFDMLLSDSVTNVKKNPVLQHYLSCIYGFLTAASIYAIRHPFSRSYTNLINSILNATRFLGTTEWIDTSIKLYETPNIRILNKKINNYILFNYSGDDEKYGVLKFDIMEIRTAYIAGIAYQRNGVQVFITPRKVKTSEDIYSQSLDTVFISSLPYINKLSFVKYMLNRHVFNSVTPHTTNNKIPTFRIDKIPTIRTHKTIELSYYSGNDILKVITSNTDIQLIYAQDYYIINISERGNSFFKILPITIPPIVLFRLRKLLSKILGITTVYNRTRLRSNI